MLLPNGPPTLYPLSQFLTLPREELLFTKRKHWIKIVTPLAVQAWIGIMVISFLYFIFSVILTQFLIFIISAGTTILLFLSLMTKNIVNWYFHFYIITTRKIVEYCCLPLTSHTVSQVRFDQVHCTEIDVRTEGIVNRLFDKGDVTLTFAPPTDTEELLLSDIHNPRKTGQNLADILDMLKTDTSKAGLWFRSKITPRHFHLTKELHQHYKGDFV